MQNTDYQVQKQLIAHIAQHLHEGHAAVMIGAGFSKNATAKTSRGKSFPTWMELCVAFKRKLGYCASPNNLECGLTPLQLASQIEARYGRLELDKILQDMIPDKDYVPSELFEALLQLPWKDVFTTNYDTLLERTDYRKTGQQYKTVVCKEDLLGSAGQHRIIKLHGSFPSNHPFIITSEDYRKYSQTHAPFVNTIQQCLLENTLCLIGFSSDDPNFEHWIGWIHDQLGVEKSPPIYLISHKAIDGITPQKEEWLQSKRIKIIDISVLAESSKYGECLTLFFEQLLQHKDEVGKTVSNSEANWSTDPHEDIDAAPDSSTNIVTETQPIKKKTTMSKTKKIISAIVGTVGLIASVITIAQLITSYMDNIQSSPKPSAFVEKTPTPVPLAKETIDLAKISFSIDSLSESEAPYACELLEARIKAFAGEEDYTFNKNSDSIDVSFPLALIGNLDIDALIKSGFNRPTELYVVALPESIWATKPSAKIRIERDQIVAATAVTGNIAAVSPLDIGLSLDSPIDYIEITFTPEISEIVMQYIVNYGNSAVLALDVEYQPSEFFYYQYLMPSENENSFIIFGQHGQNKNYNTLIAFNFMHACMPQGIKYEYSKTYLPVWEDQESLSVKGALQVSADDIASPAVEIKLSRPKFRDSLTTGQMIDAVSCIKTRLDAIGNRYAFGYGTQNPQDIYILTSIEKMGPDIINLLIANNNDLTLGMYSCEICSINHYDINSFTCSTQSNGTIKIDIVLDDDCAKELYTATKDINKDAPSRICLLLNEKPLLYSDLSAPIKTGELSLNRIVYDEQPEISADYDFILNLLDAIVNGPELSSPIDYEIASYAFISDDPEETEFGLSGRTMEDRRVIRSIQTMDIPAEIVFPKSAPGDIYICLDMDIGDNMPQKSLSLIEDIYLTCAFDDSFYSNIWFFLTKEPDNERCRVVFNRTALFDYDCYVHFIWFGERVTIYTNELELLVKKSPFFQDRICEFKFD